MDTSEISDFLRDVALSQENVLEVSRKALPEGKGDRVEVALVRRVIQPEPPAPPVRLESPRREHIFHNVDSLVNYLEKFGSVENSVVYADAPARMLYAVLDETARQGFEVVTIHPAISPELAPWMNLFKAGRVRVEAFCEFILRNRRIIETPPGKALALLFMQLKGARKITIQRGRGAKAINGLMVETEIQSQSQTDLVEIPDEIELLCPIFVGGQPLKIDVDILLEVNDENEIAVSVSSSAIEPLMIQEFDAMIVLLAQSKFRAVMGSPRFSDWKYLPAKS